MSEAWVKRIKANWLDAALLILLAHLLFFHGLTMVGDFRVDDAYITFAYSKNVALGHGPIYGYDMRVEGYSNFLWMILVAVGQFVGGSAISTARFLGYLAMAALLGATYIGARTLAGRIPAALVTLVLASCTDLHRLVQSGLETVLFCAFIACGCVHYLLEAKSERRWSLLWFSGAALTRIDGFVPLAVILGLEGFRFVAARRRGSYRRLIEWMALGVVPVALFWLWRASYYGLPFPLPYYAKASLGMLEFDRGVDYVINGFRETGLWLAIGPAIYGLSLSDRRPTIIVAAFLCVLSGYVAYVGGDWMPLNRMLFPMVAPLLVLCACGFAQVLNEVRARGWLLRTTAVLSMLLSSGFMAQRSNQWTIDSPLEQAKVGHTTHILNHTLGLLEALPYVQAMIRSPGDKLVTDYGGVYAYGTEASVIEMWGLANREIALRGNTEGINAIYGKTCVPCYAEFQPDYFHSVTPLIRGDQAFSSVGQLIGQIFQGRAIDGVISLRKDYVLGRVRRPESGQTLWFLERKRDGIDFLERRVGPFIVDYPRHLGTDRRHRERRRAHPRESAQ